MDPRDVNSVGDLHDYLRSRGRDWDHIGWRGDANVRSTDGTTLLERLPDGRIEVTAWARGQEMSREHLADERSFAQDVVNSDLASQLRTLVSQRGLFEHVSVRRMPVPGRPDEPPPEGQWTVVVSEGEWHVGGMTMGRFRLYESFEDVVLAADVLQRLVQQRGPVEQAPAGEDLARRGEVTAEGIVTRTRERGHADVPGLGPGDVLDRVGHESGSQLFALGTPFAMRSQPPDMAGAQYHRYRVVDRLPDAREGTAAAWFGQPGGGAMVVGDRPVRWYLDHGHLVELLDAEGDAGGRR